MLYIYLNKCRGFSNTTISFKDINFLLGENSTGKTSVLNLLKSLQDFNFWFDLNLNTHGNDWGGFKDILSIGEKKAKEFDVGIIQTGISKKTQKLLKRGYLLNYQNENGLPSCSFLSIFEDSVFISIKFSNKIMRYHIGDINITNTPINKIFTTLKKTKYIKSDFFKPLKIKKYAIEPKKNFVMLMAYLESDYAKKSKKDFPSFPFIIPDITHFSPIRTKPQKTYDNYDMNFNPNGEHTPYLIKKILTSRRDAIKYKKLLNNFGQSSGLFKNIKIHRLGSQTTAAFELLITLAKHPLRVDTVGYGISQILPIIVEMITRPKYHWFALQQPEIHLHPKAQAALGDLIYSLANREKKKFIIETHSDFIIDRYRINMSKHKHVISTQVLFFERKKELNLITSIPITNKGVYSYKQPKSFRKFFLKEQLELLSI